MLINTLNKIYKMITLNTVSIIVPCYNNQDTIIETLESILQQTHQNIELIVVNDGSKDYSKNVIEDFISKNTNEKIIFINQENQGPSKARNNGAKIATGMYLVFIDADDLINPNYIAKCLVVYEKNNTLNIVYSEVELFDAEKGKWELDEFKLPHFLFYNCIPIFAMIKTSVFNELGGFDENLSFTEDWELWIRIVKDYGGVYKIPEILFYYRKRLNKSSLSDNMDINSNAEKSRAYIYYKHYEFYSNYKMDLISLYYCYDNLKHFQKYKGKYYSIWYKKLFYGLKKYIRK